MGSPYAHMSLSEREAISRCLAMGMSGRALAQQLTRSPLDRWSN